MITVNLMGGLGNQMFQIAAVYSYAKRHGFDYGFDFDSCYTPLQGYSSVKYKDDFFKNLDRLDNTIFNLHYKEPHFSYNEIPKNDDFVLGGYFQSEKYFNDFRSEIIEIFNNFDLGRKALVMNFLMNLKHTKLTSVHVRRGDYINSSDFHTNLDNTDYYKNAMEIIGNEGAFIFVSDDIEWCKENFKGDNIFYSPFNEELDDLLLMKLCDNQIIANSSFSWWGAWLNENENKMVIAPENWFGPRGPKETQDLVPENWTKI
jgi:hypothetical protein